MFLILSHDFYVNSAPDEEEVESEISGWFIEEEETQTLLRRFANFWHQSLKVVSLDSGQILWSTDDFAQGSSITDTIDPTSFITLLRAIRDATRGRPPSFSRLLAAYCLHVFVWAIIHVLRAAS